MPGVPMSDLVPQLRSTLPRVLADAGEQAGRRVVEFFTAEIRNKNTREAYGRAVRQFFDWASARGLTLKAIEPVHVAAYVEQDDRSPATVKQHLSAISRLFDWLVTGQVIADKPAAPVRPPKLVVESGKTPVLTAVETRELIDSVVEDTSDVGQLRDRTIIGIIRHDSKNPEREEGDPDGSHAAMHLGLPSPLKAGCCQFGECSVVLSSPSTVMCTQSGRSVAGTS